MSGDDLLNQAEIEKLLAQNKQQSPPESSGGPPQAGDDRPLDQSEIESLLNSAKGSAAAQPAAPGAGSQDQDADKILDQSEIERLLQKTGRAAPPTKAGKPPVAEPAPTASESEIPREDLEYLLRQAEQAIASLNTPDPTLPPGVIAFQLPEFAGAPPSTETATLDLIKEVELDVKIELGRTRMYLEDVLRLRRGAVVPLDKLAGDPVDIYINGRLVARGEVLVLNDSFCVRVAELVAGQEPVAEV
ncbi:MAG: hypothetical protein Kow0040_03610 [Thermogutta sp.]